MHDNFSISTYIMCIWCTPYQTHLSSISMASGFVTQCINSFANIIFAYVYYPAHVHVQHWVEWLLCLSVCEFVDKRNKQFTKLGTLGDVWTMYKSQMQNNNILHTSQTQKDHTKSSEEQGISALDLSKLSNITTVHHSSWKFQMILRASAHLGSHKLHLCNDKTQVEQW